MTDYLMPLSRFLAETEFADLPAAAVDRALLTALAAVELAGMRLVAEDADEEAYAVNVLRAGGRPP